MMVTAWLLCVCCVSWASWASCAEDPEIRKVLVSGDDVLSELAVLVLCEAGFLARAHPAELNPRDCRVDTVDSARCVGALQKRLKDCIFVNNTPCVEVGVLVSEEMPLSSWQLGGRLEYIGDAAPPARRSCWTEEPDLRSLDDLRREGAERYTVSAPAGPELVLLQSVALRDGWKANVLRAGNASADIQCGWIRPSVGGSRELAPPAGPWWAPRRVATLVDPVALAELPRAMEVLARIKVNATGERELRETGAREWAARHEDLVWDWAHGTGQPILTVAVECAGLKAADAAAETARGLGSVNVTVLCGGCTAAGGAALAEAAADGPRGGERALVGPACGAGQRAAGGPLERLRVPLVSYTPSGTDADAALRTAGDARKMAATWGAVCAELRWRRVAILTEWAARHQADSDLLQVDPVHRVDLPDTHDPTDLAPILEWVQTSANRGARVLLVAAEDERVVRGALCVGWREGLLPPEFVWLLPPALRGDWDAEQGQGQGEGSCSRDMLQAVLEGHLMVAPAGLLELGGGEGAVPLAALLNDTMVLVAAALLKLRERGGKKGGHRARLLRAARAINYTGLTGHFAFRDDGARDLPVSIYQRRGGLRRAAGEYDGSGPVELELRWGTPDGATPEDGPRCSLGALAAALHVHCSAGPSALAALLLAAVAVLGAAGAALGRRAMRRRFRRRLMRAARDSRPPCDARWELPAERVVINRRLGAGSCGTVYGGHARLDPNDDGAWTAVAVKTLRADAGAAEKLDFLSETETLKGLEHENVVRLLGLVTRAGPPRAVLELAALGDLRSYLAARRGAQGEATDVAPRTLTRWALEAARALSYLRAKRVVHRDVAARNCLLTARRTLRLADFGMARRGADCEQYQLARRGLLPVRWMAPESVSRGVFSPASDVWSLGVLYTEMVSLGALPYAELHNWQVAERLRAGRCPPAPECPRLTALLNACWRLAPRERPTAAAVAAFLADRPRLLRAARDALSLPPPPEPAPPDDRPEPTVDSTATDDTYLSYQESLNLPDDRDATDSDSFLP